MYKLDYRINVRVCILSVDLSLGHPSSLEVGVCLTATRDDKAAPAILSFGKYMSLVF